MKGLGILFALRSLTSYTIYTSTSSTSATRTPLIAATTSSSTLKRMMTSSSSTTTNNNNNKNSDPESQPAQEQEQEQPQDKKQYALVVDPFCYRQFAEHHEASQSYGGTVFSIPMDQFTDIVNQRYYSSDQDLKDGYAPFCKHLFVENDFTDAKTNVLPITPSNYHLLRTKYEARNEKELPVLTRFFPKELILNSNNDNDKNELPTAKYLDLILYSRDQINKENAAQGQEPSNAGVVETAPWGIVSIKAQDVNYETPMTPITAMRNALGKEEGGSGIPIDRDSYMEAYHYWNTHATVS